jgi:NarL family two-component system response regulator LiaR
MLEVTEESTRKNEQQHAPERNVPLYSLLSEREREMLSLIANGHSNSEIAQRLVISEKTVKSHVGNILSKLHLADRTQVAVFAWREGLV